MTTHLVKLCVGLDSPEALEAYMAAILSSGRSSATMALFTRSTPKRRTEILDGGSLYWIMRGRICCRQAILDVETLKDEERSLCRILLAPEIVRVEPRARKPFQGWRYLAAADAPPDIRQTTGDGVDALPDAMREELESLGLL